MKQMKIKLLSSGDYGFTIEGNTAVKKLIGDKETAQIDLLVRESIQNSIDAIKKESRNCVIKFDLTTFDNSDIEECIEEYGYCFTRKFGSGKKQALVITDLFTTGLLGEPFYVEGESNNLFKLVYAFLRGKNDAESGGSWGVGKSVYFRYGGRVVFYYSRTFEHGKYISKLAGTILEDQTKPDRIFRENTKYCGVAFIGDEGKGQDGKRSIPIYDEEEINHFLSIFDIQPFFGNQTGTAIIIPYFDEQSCLHDRRNDEHASWEDSFVASLKMSIQRWYFTKLSNPKEGKFINVFVNGEEVKLIPFFKKLQDLYNGDNENANELPIIASNFDVSNNVLGTFRYKKFTKEELDVLTRPNFYPSPYVLLDIETSGTGESNSPIVFYTRNPHMIVTYEDKDLTTSLKTDQNEYIIGVFILNDKASKKGETIGQYFRASEYANHKKWSNVTDFENFPEISSLKTKPFSTLRKTITGELNKKYGVQDVFQGKVQNTKLQQEFSDLFLPSEGYGKNKSPSIKRKKHKEKKEDPPLPKPKSSEKDRIYFDGFVDGKPSYTIQAIVKPNFPKTIHLLVSTSSGKYSLFDWLEYGLTTPFIIKKVNVNKYVEDKSEVQIRGLDFKSDNNPWKTLVVRYSTKEPIFKISPETFDNETKLSGIVVENCIEKPLSVNVSIQIEPINPLIRFDLDVFDNSDKGGDK